MNRLPELLKKWYEEDFRRLPVSEWDETFCNEARCRIEEAEKMGRQLFKQQNDSFVWLSLLLSFYHFPTRIGSHMLLTESWHIEVSLFILTNSQIFADLITSFTEETVHAVVEDLWEPLLCFSRIPNFCLSLPQLEQIKLEEIDVSKWSVVNSQRMQRAVEEKNKNRIQQPNRQPVVEAQQGSRNCPPSSTRRQSSTNFQKTAGYSNASGRHSSYQLEKEEYLENHRKHVEEFERCYKFPKDREPQLNYESANLFSSYQSLAHCVSEDMSMSAGIAIQFVERFTRIKEVCWRQNITKGGVAVYEDRKNRRFIYNLVTKENFNDKPQYPDFKSALEAMKTHALQKNVPEISIPQIGCGLDGLNWEFVSKLVDEIFDDSGIQITVFIPEVSNKKPGHRYGNSGASFESGGFKKPGRAGESPFQQCRRKERTSREQFDPFEDEGKNKCESNKKEKMQESADEDNVSALLQEPDDKSSLENPINGNSAVPSDSATSQNEFAEEAMGRGRGRGRGKGQNYQNYPFAIKNHGGPRVK